MIYWLYSDKLILKITMYVLFFYIHYKITICLFALVHPLIPIIFSFWPLISPCSYFKITSFHIHSSLALLLVSLRMSQRALANSSGSNALLLSESFLLKSSITLYGGVLFFDFLCFFFIVLSTSSTNFLNYSWLILPLPSMSANLNHSEDHCLALYEVTTQSFEVLFKVDLTLVIKSCLSSLRCFSSCFYSFLRYFSSYFSYWVLYLANFFSSAFVSLGFFDYFGSATGAIGVNITYSWACYSSCTSSTCSNEY